MNRNIDLAANALERMSDGLYVLDEQWRFIHVNPQAEQMLHRPAAELLGQVITDALPAVRDGNLLDLCRVALLTGEHVRFEATYAPFDHWYDVRLFGSDGLVYVFLTEITARRQAEAALRESEQRLRLVLDSLPVGVWLTEPDGTITAANPAGQRIWAGARYVGPAAFGLYRGWWHGSGSLIAPEEWALARVARDGQPVLGEILDIEAFDGARKTIRNSAVPMRDAAGAVTGLIAINEDITEQHQAELRLAIATTQMQRLFEAGPIGIATGSRDGRIRTINDEMLRILGRSRADVLGSGMSWMDLTPPEHLERGEQAVSEASERGASAPYEKQFIRPDGSRIWVMMGLLGTGTNEGLAFAVDIQAHKDVEIQREALLVRERALRAETERERERLARLQRLTAALAEAVTVDDVAAVSLEEGMALLGAVAGMIVARTVEDPDELMILRAAGYREYLVDPSARIPLARQAPITDTVRTGNITLVSSSEELADRYPDLAASAAHTGHQVMLAVPLTVRGTPIGGLGLSFAEQRSFAAGDIAFLQALAGLAGSALDRARLYDEAQRARQAAEAASLAKDEFLSVISHELRTPLTPIAAYAELLHGGRLHGALITEALEAILRNAGVEARLVEDLLDASRISSGNLPMVREPLDLTAAVSAAVSAARPAATAAGLSLFFAAAPDDLVVTGDSARLQQAVTNLLTNAITFTPPGGRIEVTLRPDGPEAVLVVQDSGSGIAPAFLPHVFERFRQEDNSRTRRHGGLGLGLAIVHFLVEQHGGQVTAASEGTGKGATFTIRLPRAAAFAPGTAAGVAEMAGGLGGALAGLRLLAVDDDADTRRLLEVVLTAEGALVETAADAAEALARAEQQAPDLLITDLGLTGGDGHMLLRTLRRLPDLSGLPAIALTAYAAEEDRRAALAAGFHAHLAKPMHPDALIALIRRLTREHGAAGDG